MAENVLKLKKKAVDLGMPKKDAMNADRPTLEEFIANAEKKSSKAKSEKKSTKKKGVEKKSGTTKKKSTKKSSEKAETTKKKSPKKASEKKSSTKTKAKPKASDNGDVGRASIGEIDWSIEHENWNPRKGGPTERMFKALKKYRGNVDKAFDALKGDLYDFVGRTKRNGEKRTKDEALAVFKYRLNRTKYEYATRTEQHETATNRVEYGTGDAAKANKKATRKASTKKSPAKTTSTKKTGTKKSSKKKSKK